MDVPVDPVECTFEISSSSSTCIYGPGQGQGPPWSMPSMEIHYISVGRPPIATWGLSKWPGGGLLKLENGFKITSFKGGTLKLVKVGYCGCKLRLLLSWQLVTTKCGYYEQNYGYSPSILQ